MRSLISRGHRFDDFFKDFAPGLFVRPLRENWIWDGQDMPIDVRENEQAYTVEADLPGVEKKDIQVSVQDNAITVRAESRRSSEQTVGNCLRQERYEGQISRTFTLPGPVDQAKASAHYEKGVLTLTLPKSTASSQHTLAIE
jgi:HSP20 family protein